jgi:ABC-type amino acid transport substrate-binding protein
MNLSKLSTLAAAVAAVATLSATPAHAGKTIDAIKARGQVICGVNPSLPGFAAADSQGNWTGLDVDICKAIAATVLALAGQRSQARSLVAEAHRLEPRKLGLASLWGLAALNLDDKAGAEHFFRLAKTNCCAATYYLVDSAFLAPHQQDAVVTNYRRNGSDGPQAQTETLIAMAL